MQKIEGKTIVLTKGDTFKATVGMVGDDGSPYTPEAGDVVRFHMKKAYKDANLLIEKIIPNSTLLLQLNPVDTSELDVGNYVYDIQITYANGDVDTFIDRGVVKLTEEVEGIAPPIPVPTGGSYERGEWAPEEDVARGTIPFVNQHSTAPYYYLVARKSAEVNTTPSAFLRLQAVNWKAIFGHGERNTQDSTTYGLIDVGYANSVLPDRVNNNQLFVTNDPDVEAETPTAQDWSYYATNTELRPGFTGLNYTWKASETYQWFAVWMPER